MTGAVATTGAGPRVPAWLPAALWGLPLWIAAALIGVVTGSAVLFVASAAAVLLGVALSRRLSTGSFGEVLMCLAAVGLSIPLASALVPPGDDARLPVFWTGLALSGLLCAAARLLLAAPAGGPRFTYVLGLCPLAACGQVRIGPVYLLAIGSYLLAALVALRAEDPTRTPWAALPRRERFLALLLPIFSLLLWGAVTAPLVPLHGFVIQHFDLSYLGGVSGRARGRFTDRMRLGSLREVLDSDQIVLRVYDPSQLPVDYLRGAVYDHYENGRWQSRRQRRLGPGPVGRGPLPGANGVEVRRVSGDPERLFSPLALAALSTNGEILTADDFGILRGVEGQVRRYWLREGPRQVALPMPPGPDDLQLPPALKAPLSTLAAEWTAGQTTSAGKLAAIGRRLTGGYAYSLSFQLSGKGDPVLEFLHIQKQGHCEYFAASMALLARAAGVPARVVGGYRVTEHNPLGGYHLVRERNAHTWVEAHVPGTGDAAGWATYDPTPAGSPPELRTDTPGWAALRDLLNARLAGAWAWLLGRSRTELSAVLLAVLAIFLAIRRLSGRRVAGEKTEDRFDRPLAGYQDLERALLVEGTRRLPWEPLEDFARRVKDAEAAALITRYAALRYGGLGDEIQIEAELRRCAGRLLVVTG